MANNARKTFRESHPALHPEDIILQVAVAVAHVRHLVAEVEDRDPEVAVAGADKNIKLYKCKGLVTNNQAFLFLFKRIDSSSP